MTKKLASELRKGDIIVEENGSLHEVVATEHTMNGKRTSCIQVNTRALKQANRDSKGSARNRYQPDAAVEVMTLIGKECQFLYEDVADSAYVVMSAEDSEYISVDHSIVGDLAPWITEDITLTVYCDGDRPVYIALPTTVDCEVQEADLKTQRVTSSYKSAVLTNGVKVMVPPFIEAGDYITVLTEDCTYVGKAKKSGDV